MADDEQQEEERQRTADKVLGFVEDVIYWGIAVVLVAGALVLLGVQVYAFTRLIGEPSETVLVEILDGLLLVFIFVELLFAVRVTLRSHEIVAEPFLIVGIIVCIKEIVVLSVQSASLLSDGPEFSRGITEVGVLGGLVLVLALAMYVLRLRREETAEDVGEEAADAADEADDAERTLEQAGRDREQAGETRDRAAGREADS